MSERHACVVTTGRQDYGLLRSTILALRDAPDFRLSVLAGGMHLRERFGNTIDLIRADAVPVARELDFVAEPPSPGADAARALAAVHAALSDIRPDFVILAGDRSETLAAATAAVLVPVPVVHLHGGEETEGAMDNVMRHGITKLSHLHLVSGELPRRRVIQMGEDATSVVIVGAPGLDNASRTDLPTRKEIEARVGLEFDRPVVLVTVHSTTLREGSATAEVAAVAAAMERVDAVYVITHPNADEGGAEILEFWKRWIGSRSRVALVDALGDRFYWGMLREAHAVLGNSSSGIIEAPAIGVPAIDVGDRQRGRQAGPGVTRVSADPQAIEIALRQSLATSPSMRSKTPDVAWPKILGALREWSIPRNCRKAFQLLP